MIDDVVEPDAERYMDENSMYVWVPNHETVNDTEGKYVAKFGPNTNGLESHWSMFKREF